MNLLKIGWEEKYIQSILENDKKIAYILWFSNKYTEKL